MWLIFSYSAVWHVLGIDKIPSVSENFTYPAPRHVLGIDKCGALTRAAAKHTP